MLVTHTAQAGRSKRRSTLIKTMTATDTEGRSVSATVGAAICFKADIEQSAIVKEIRYGGWNGRVPQVRVDVSVGGYAGPDQWLDLADCWN
jgi:hypothetical protein